MPVPRQTSASLGQVVDEEARLVALHSYGSPAEVGSSELTAIARLAAHVCEAERGAVTLVDSERVWQIAAHGAGIEDASRADSPEAFLVRGRAPVAVDDSGHDDESDRPFPGAALLARAGVRRYVAAPLLSPAGHVLGAVSASSGMRGPVDAVQVERMRDLAAQVLALLELRRLSAALDGTSSHDAVTGLVNRLGFDDLLVSALRRAERGLGTPSVLVVSVEEFLTLGDRHGGRIADVVLREVATRLTSTARSADTAARIGEAQFALVLEHTAEAGAADAVTRLRSGIAGPVRVNGEAIPIGCSLGVASYRAGDTAAVLLARAEAARVASQGR